MAKKPMKFVCEQSDCKKVNWLFLDPEDFNKKEIIISCCACGHVYGWADKEKLDDDGESCCVCLPFKGFERKETTGPVGPDKTLTDDTLWGTATGSGQGITRAEFMKKHGIDPYVDWCKRNPNAPICEGFEFRCKSKEKIKRIGDGSEKGGKWKKG